MLMRRLPVAWWRQPFRAEQRATLVNVRVKWVKDRALDSVVARERHLRHAHHLLDLISSDTTGRIPACDLSHRSSKLGLDVLSFLRYFPTIFRETRPSSSSSYFSLTDAALRLRQLELDLLRDTESDLVDRLRRFLMLTLDRSVPLHTIDLLHWDLGLPRDYRLSLLPRYPQFFDLVHPPGDERVWLRLLCWDRCLAVSELQRSSGVDGDGDGFCLAFPVSFTRGFGIKKKCATWLKEWQTLPYTSPYADASALDPRTDVSEKRIVGVFHELLHLTVAKKTERRNVSNLRKPLGLPQKFTKVFERHPGIFYLSQKLATQTVVLREAYGGARELINKHPLVAIREEYAAMMRAAMPAKRRGASHHKAEASELEGGSSDSNTEEDGCSDVSGTFDSQADYKIVKMSGEGKMRE
ncbi:protein WHAT'S THIS FACTOR 9, mitochondrial [Typha angustifolia]|uniref:protein WHAT'S THIS FACTOR 9, mitochondrial n=1 Tax=Typha angustifolia TaxID=59011 RepID=UPI003C2D8E41